MISMKELNPHSYVPTEEQSKNLTKLHTIMNKIRTAYGKPMIITSGLRSLEDQTRIDRPKGMRPRRSMHLIGAACDVWDRDKEFWNWLMKNMKLLEELDVYLEDKTCCPTWVHIQLYPPQSGRRIFIP